MSYILDALRKSEQQRQRGETPRLLALQTMPEADARPAFLKYGLIAAALIGAGVAIGVLRPWQHASSVTDPMLAPLSAFPEVAVKSGQEQAMQKSGMPAKRNADPAVTVPRQGRPLVSKPQGQTGKFPPRIASAIPAQTSASGHAARAAPAPGKAIVPIQEPMNAGHAGAANRQTVLAMTELPLAIQREVPGISIQGHVFSSAPKDRVVAINGRLAQEGEYVAPGLKLEQITTDGLVFSYRNYLSVTACNRARVQICSRNR
jgi:general secretion pathway protein B